jgi:hypothetical protein
LADPVVGERILVIKDDPDYVEFLMKDVLHPLQFQLPKIEAQDVTEALVN